MRRCIRHPLPALDIEDALRRSLERFGPRQAARYADIIEDAIDHVSAYPTEGRRYRLRPAIGCSTSVVQVGVLGTSCFTAFTKMAASISCACCMIAWS